MTCQLVLIVSLLFVAAARAQVLGVDANYAPDMVAQGKVWTAGGKPVAPLDAFAKAGMNTLRVRVWVGDGGVNRLKYATELAKRAQVAGLKPLPVLFLGEDWADLVKQPAPKAWSSLDEDAKAAAVEAYCERTVRHLQQAGVDADTFEIGNEIDFGLCGVFEEAWANRVSVDLMRAKVWPRMVPLLKAAQRGVAKAKPDAKFVLHLAQWNNSAYCVAFFDYMIKQGVRIDYAGLSYFPSSAADAGQRSLAFLGGQIKTMSDAVRRPVLICETGYPAAATFGGQFADWNKPADGYPLTPAGQATWTNDLIAFAKADKNLAGVIFWSPEWYGNGLWDAFAWFDDAGHARPVLNERAATTKPSAVNVYLGNLHAHTGASDGTGTAAEAFAFARDTAKLDFLAVTDHNHLLGGEKADAKTRAALYASILDAAKQADRPGSFVALTGQEFSSMSKGNHINAFDVPAVIDMPNGAFDGLLAWLDAHPDSTGQPAVVMFNHPALGWFENSKKSRLEFGRDDFADDAGWVKNMGRVTHLVELLNGEPGKNDPPGRAPQQMEQHYRRLLRLGFRVAPTGDQDNHKKQWGTVTDVRTGVLAAELSKPSLLAAMRARHVFASEDKNLRVVVTANDGLCGDEITTAGPLRVTVKIDDADEFAARYTVEAVSGRVGGDQETVTKVATIDGNTPTPGNVDGVSLNRPGDYVYFRITQSSAQGVDRLWTAPVWLSGSKAN